MIDTHCHLNSEQLYKRIDEVILKADSVAINRFIVPGYDFETSKIALEIAHKYPNCYAAIGFHPTEIKGYSDEYKWLEENANDDKVVAIGECGYDFHWDVTTKEEQEEAFIKQIEIAKKVNKPLIIHSRDAIQLTFDTLKTCNASRVGGVMHAFSGSLEMAKRFVKEGFYLGIGGTVTFKNAKDPIEIVKEIDLKHLLSETDSPYLTPHSYRGKVNEPYYMKLVIEKIAEIKGIMVDEVSRIIDQNVKKLFKI